MQKYFLDLEDLSLRKDLQLPFHCEIMGETICFVYSENTKWAEGLWVSSNSIIIINIIHRVTCYYQPELTTYEKIETHKF